MGVDGGDEVAAFVAAAREATGEPIEAFDVFAFGDSPAMADEIAALVVAGRKRATASLLAAYEADDEPLPGAGAWSVVADGAGRTVAPIWTREVTIRAFRDVDAAFARDEGEGDRSLRYWREAHRAVFARSDAGFSDASVVVCERFEMVSPSDRPTRRRAEAVRPTALRGGVHHRCPNRGVGTSHTSSTCGPTGAASGAPPAVRTGQALRDARRAGGICHGMVLVHGVLRGPFAALRRRARLPSARRPPRKGANWGARDAQELPAARGAARHPSLRPEEPIVAWE